MIEYKYPEEKEIVLHYAKLLNDTQAQNILNKGYVENKEEALALKDFYWAMLEQSIKDQGDGVQVMVDEGVDVWMEYVFHTFNGYLVSNGYEEEWDAE